MCKKITHYNVTPEQFGFLNTLYNTPGISQKELSEICYKDQPTTARILDKLKKKGLITCQTSSVDRRTSVLHITDEGKKLRKQLVPLAEKTLEKALQGFSDKEIKQLKIMLNKIFSNLDQ